MILRECPTRCPLASSKIEPISKALRRIYNDLDIKCKFFNKWNQIVKLCDLDKHEQLCQLPKCFNFEQCNNLVKQVLYLLLTMLEIFINLGI